MSTRAEAVAEVLWELKKAEKLATFSEIAQRAGFSAGSKGRSMLTCLKQVRKDWGHLEWWRAVSDDLLIPKDSEQFRELSETDFELTDAEQTDDCLTLVCPEDSLHQWSAVTT
jgi:alkylated DNA nucleotide flippase Atl1